MYGSMHSSALIFYLVGFGDFLPAYDTDENYIQ
jgi:hypothetical protein